MNHVYVEDMVHCWVTEEGDPDDSWSRDSTNECHDIRGIRLRSWLNACDSVPTAVEPERGRDYYLLVVYYDTGDSFGRDEGKVEFFELYESRELADENARRLNEGAQKGESSVTLKSPSGEEYQQSTLCWTGYFETYNGAEVRVVRRLD